jgi:hypothetical protein
MRIEFSPHAPHPTAGRGSRLEIRLELSAALRQTM